MAARFATWSAAERALSALRNRFHLEPSDVSVAPLGGSDQPHGSVYLLAGRFDEPRVNEARRMIEGGGGVIVADVDEGWTRPRIRRTGEARAHGSGWRRQAGSMG